MHTQRIARLLSVGAGLIAGVTLAVASGASGARGPVARDSFAVFGSGAPAAPEQQLASLADEVGLDATDKTQFRVLEAGAGEFHSRLVAFPARSGSLICYALLGAKPEDPGMSYCYAPRDGSVPAQLRGERFSAVALQSTVDGQTSTQLFGVAEDAVSGVRVNVAGTWREAALKRNGFYLDFPGVAHRAIGVVEVTLADGSTQVHDIQTGM